MDVRPSRAYHVLDAAHPAGQYFAIPEGAGEAERVVIRVDTIYMIERLWTDSMENQRSDAMGYNPVGFVLDYATAVNVVEAGGHKQGDGWPIPRGESKPRFRYVRLNRVDGPGVGL